MELLTAAQMRGIEAAAIASGAVTGLALMERAGAAVVAALLEEWPELAAGAHRAVVLCGPGNNGGDGYVVARLLRARGWEVAVFALAPPATADAQAMAALWGAEVRPAMALDWPDLESRPLVVDAMFGGGLARDIAAGVWGLLAMAQASRCRIVAVDVPSGICADSGRVRSEAGYIDAPVDLTVTFQTPRLGHHLLPGAALCGRLRVADIGLAAALDALLRRDAGEIVDLARPRGGLGKQGGHKFSHGAAVVLAGPAGRGGAARLAARGALRVGAGLVTVGSPPEALAEHAARLDAVMLRDVADGAALARLLEDRRITAVCVGPGLGLDARAAGMVRAVLEQGRGEPRRATVLDADALTLLARDPGLFALLHPRCVLTPHAGEFARLFPDIAAELAAPAAKGPAFSKVDATRAAAARAGCVVLVKGADTVIADPQGACCLSSALYDRAAPWLATAGSGDVLAGFIAGLLARGFDPMHAAETGAWLHVEAARAFGPGLIAEDLPEMLPRVFRSLGIA